MGSHKLDPNKSPTSPFNDDQQFQDINLDNDFNDENLNVNFNTNELPKRSGTGASILRKSSSQKRRNNPNARIVFSDHDTTINEDDNISNELTKSTSNESFQHTPKNLQQTPRFEDDLNNEDTVIDASDIKRKDSVMKRHRWGTQRNKKGKPTVGRAKTLRWKSRHEKPHDDNSTDDELSEEEKQKNRANEFRSIYFNMPLPQEMVNENGEPLAQYPRNKIRTTKYTAITFLPKNLILQFKNIANIFFLIMVVMGFFSIFGVPNPGLSMVPLVVIVIITGIKDAVEDSRRTGLDMEVNNTPTHILDGVINHNQIEDNISLWRRFKKLNTRMVFSFFRFCDEHFTKTGKEKARLSKLAKESMSMRKSFDSFEDNRKSVQLDDLSSRQSFENPFNDNNNISNNDSIIDPNINLSSNQTSPKFEKNYWKNVKVGDILRIHNNDEIPADIILLSTSDSDGACYVETKNLDGETNLKVRQALKAGHQIRHSKDIQRSKFWVESEGPHANLYNYQGNMKWYGEESQIRNEPITINNLLLRGCSLRNTKWALGIVVFTGADTKIMLNSGLTPTKKSRISRELNYAVLYNFFLLFILCFVSGLVNGITYNQDVNSRNQFEYGTIGGSPIGNGFVAFFVALILYQSLIPISLYISIEILKTAQAYFIYSDVNMYYERLDYPCTPKSWNISDDLGQIEYIFSDKTGTLTQNVMEFKKCTINGVSYGRAYTEALAGLRKRQGIDVEEESTREKKAIVQDKETMIQNLYQMSQNSQLRPNEVTFVSKEFVQDLQGAKGDPQQRANEHFMLSLAICHSVLAEKDKNDEGRVLLKAQSPDEAALVGTARDVGYAFIGRTKKGVILEVHGVEKEFQVLNVLEFNSTRKRMSAIIKIPSEVEGGEPKALLICKGADSIIYSRLKSQSDETLLERTALHLEEYATEGLRTLCIAQRELNWDQYTEWNKRHEIAAAALVKREEKMEEVADSIERELELLGGTAIEDRLQDGVPDAIAVLAQAGIKLWVLTGDKVETAINIGFSCNLLGNDLELLVLKTSGDDVEKISNDPKQIVSHLLEKYLNEKFNMQGTWDEVEEAKSIHEPPQGNFGVVIDGDALKIALQGDNMRKFLLLCKQCKAVLCCRVSPAQKAAVVKMVKETLDVMTLAIGDGSNDVAMIQSADIGVGIAGEEGRQAVMSSDYAFGQFRYLARLLLVHGRWSYKRLAEMIPTFFYKNVIFTLALFWYGIYNQFDGSYLFEYTYLMFYNLAFTSLPVIFMGIFDQDVNDVISLLVPQLYKAGILRSEWTMKKFWFYMIDGIYQSVISFFFPYILYYKTGLVTYNGLNLDHRYWIGTLVASIAAISCNLYILMHLFTWDWFSCLFIFLSIIIVFGWTGIWSSALTSAEYYKAGAQVYGSTSFWACLLVGIIMCVLPRFIYDVVQKYFYPKDVDIIRECFDRGDFSQYPANYDPTDPDRPKISKYSADYSVENQIVQNSKSTPGSAGPTSPMSSKHKNSSIFKRQSFSKNSRKSKEYPIDYDQELDTEEISMNQYVDASGTPRFTENEQRFNNIDERVQRHEDDDDDDIIERYAPRTSLDRTRLSMQRDRQGQPRQSVENARTSLDLPGLTRAETLMSNRSNK
ncbi:phospholipid-translocating ATPase [Wickerhamomyces ciferrii]|uniref:Phospholipid-transporting ATPase n=1 Tax=Wickerhamomyces ciferrii (strain ATCC 14091 / BCRC 22168 / CBS 111 / JCM 3599 / NBRC 0793 / NRRL Y-1031 F-60-10) TaxID=1206466 RepID=K0KNY2_WICCF|nr:phospholipid-translocating ATPase [Wickerhamomyces ciferrii]CCH43109.1 phospholipid-translocating ATPase [Wickerhamomyces ciferrii]